MCSFCFRRVFFAGAKGEGMTGSIDLALSEFEAGMLCAILGGELSLVSAYDEPGGGFRHRALGNIYRALTKKMHSYYSEGRRGQGASEDGSDGES